MNKSGGNIDSIIATR